MKKRGARSSDGVPNRSGGTWPNHSAQRYELPIPFSPGADNVTDEYRANYERIFGKKNDPSAKYDVPTDQEVRDEREFGMRLQKMPAPAPFRCLDCPSDGTQCERCASIRPEWATLEHPIVLGGIIATTPCEVCGEMGAYHRLDRGVFTCEIES